MFSKLIKLTFVITAYAPVLLIWWLVSVYSVFSRNEEITYIDFKDLYVDLRKKNDSQKINLAILKIKEEQDFVEFNLLKYIEILKDLDLIESDFYDRIKYGTSNKNIITLLKNGFSLELAKCITQENYLDYIQINISTEEIIIKNGIIEEMSLNNENKILIFE